MKDLISVIVPVYQSEDSLRRCVESLLAQTYRNLEIILVDDGSPDECPKICDAFREMDARVRVVHKKNGGVSSARNAGILEARGSYVQFVDSDDFVEKDCCGSMYEALRQAGAYLALCGYHHHYAGEDVVKIPPKGEDLLGLYGLGFLNMPWNKLFLREYLGRFPEDLSLGEDLLFNLEYLRKCRIGNRGRLAAGQAEGQGLQMPVSEVALVERSLCHYIQEESRQTLSNQKRADKLELAKRIRRETEAFFLERAGWTQEKDPEKGRGISTEKYKEQVRRVTDTRFLCECLDDVERLPFEKDMTGAQKRRVIRKLCRDRDVQEACRRARPEPLDYRILQQSLRLGLVWGTYLLSVLRSFAVRWKRRDIA